LVFEKNANFFTENCQKSQKIVIIAPTPGLGRKNDVAPIFQLVAEPRERHLAEGAGLRLAREVDEAAVSAPQPRLCRLRRVRPGTNAMIQLNFWQKIGSTQIHF
jgi:hypothetical protein